MELLDTSREIFGKNDWTVIDVESGRLITMGYSDGFTARKADEEMSIFLSQSDIFIDYSGFMPFEQENNDKDALVRIANSVSRAVAERKFKTYTYLDKVGTKTGEERVIVVGEDTIVFQNGRKKMFGKKVES